ncbi:BTAD domain-containing putative transcriptional regulator [Micromonospora sp. NPDC048871]|uniref:AfsR/SARP family transcriptional regulator n=1 Tax=Micromonospora sp. NPDC048871 TaxID=3364259 RepID=UPI00371E110B|nr:AfsR/SARP family transcriptional regulator [Micromonospora sp. NBC_01739]
MNGINHAPSAPKLRSILAVLLVHAGQAVPVSSLIRELWDEDPPASGLTTLQTYILNLRKLLARVTGISAAEISKNVLVTKAGGYVLQVDSGILDVHQYHSLVTAAREALSAGDDETGVRKMTDGLRLWRGPALVDVPIGPVLESKRRQFEESRLVVLEYLVDAELRLGMYREVLTELAALTVENPLHEGIHAQYMLALYHSGRRAQALQVFHRLRGDLVNELGLEPGPSVQRLHRAVLNAEVVVEDQLSVSRSLGDIVGTSAWGNARQY